MTTKLKAVLAAIAALVVVAVPMLAHHSFAAEFDPKQSISLTGVVTKVEWMNPHTHFYIDVKDEKGNVTNWDLETGSPNGLSRMGWTRHSLKEGDVVSLQAFRAKDGSSLASARMVTLADGRRIFAGAANNDGGPGTTGPPPAK